MNIARRLVCVLSAVVAFLVGIPGGLAQEERSVSQMYTPKEVRETKAEAFFQRLGDPEAGRAPFAAMQALIEKAQGSAADKDEVLKLAAGIVGDAKAPEMRRWQTLYVLSGTTDPRAIATLVGALKMDPSTTVRGVAACALGSFAQAEAIDALKQAAEGEKDADVRGWINKALTGEMRAPAGDAGKPAIPIPTVNDASAKAVLDGTHFALVLVKDFMRMENTGGELAGVEFQRYTPVIDDEQFVVARWFDGAADDGAVLPVEIATMRADVEGNLIHTLKLAKLPAHQQAVVTVTTLVARRERPAPKGEFPIPKPEEYPEAVRAFLASTPMVDVQHKAVKRQADVLLSRSEDALQLAHHLADLMRAKSYAQTGQPEAGMPTSAVVLKFGGSCCGSAVCAAAVLRAAGIPAQVTYCPPPSYVHGIVRFYLNGYGWVRMDSTCGTGKLPLVQDDGDLKLVRLFDMPVKMEQIDYAYAWPYEHNDEDGQYAFRVNGAACPSVQFASKDKPGENRVSGHIGRPFPHLEPGSWSTVLGMEAMPEAGVWSELVKASRQGVLARQTDEVAGVVGRVPALGEHVRVAREFAREAGKKEE